MPFTPPPTAVAWKVRHYTGRRGRPKMMFTEHGPAHLDLDATMEDLRTLVKDATGVYWLYMVDAEGNELEPIACIELLPKDSAQNLTVVGEDAPAATSDASAVAAAPTVVQGQAAMPGPGPGSGQWLGSNEERQFMMELCRQMLASRDAHDERMTALVSKLVHSTVSIQEQVAGSLTALNESVRVANGLDAVARLPPAPDVDAEEIAEMVADALDSGDEKDDKSNKKSWIDTIFSGPLGMMIVNTIQGVTTGMQQGQRVQAEAMAMEAEAKQAEAEAARMAAEAEMIKAATAAGLKVKVANEYSDDADEPDEDEAPETAQDHETQPTEDETTAAQAALVGEDQAQVAQDQAQPVKDQAQPAQDQAQPAQDQAQPTAGQGQVAQVGADQALVGAEQVRVAEDQAQVGEDQAQPAQDQPASEHADELA
ncbi:MAG: hypothetical protein AAGC55_19020, partial [Myxococcota bacterium]